MSALLDRPQHAVDVAGEPVLENHRQADAGLLRDANHAGSAVMRDRHRLFGDDVLAGLGGEDGLLRMETGRRAENDEVDVRLGEHLRVRGVPGGVVLFGEGTARVLTRVGHRDDRDVVDPFEGAGVDLADGSGPDNAYLECFGHGSTRSSRCPVDGRQHTRFRCVGC